MLDIMAVTETRTAVPETRYTFESILPWARRNPNDRVACLTPTTPTTMTERLRTYLLLVVLL